MNLYELKSRCIDEVAREIARPRVKGRGPDVWVELQIAALPEAIEKIQAMSNMELLDLISEVARRE